MDFDVLVGVTAWQDAAQRARELESVGISGMVFTETGQTPWMSMAAAAGATSRLQLCTGVAVAFPRSPMVTASLAWELAGNSRGRFRLGLGSQVRAHVERRYGVDFDLTAIRALAARVDHLQQCRDRDTARAGRAL